MEYKKIDYRSIKDDSDFANKVINTYNTLKSSNKAKNMLGNFYENVHLLGDHGLRENLANLLTYKKEGESFKVKKGTIDRILKEAKNGKYGSDVVVKSNSIGYDANALKEDIKKGELSTRKIADKYGVSTSTVYRRKKEVNTPEYDNVIPITRVRPDNAHEIVKKNQESRARPDSKYKHVGTVEEGLFKNSQPEKNYKPVELEKEINREYEGPDLSSKYARTGSILEKGSKIKKGLKVAGLVTLAGLGLGVGAWLYGTQGIGYSAENNEKAKIEVVQIDNSKETLKEKIANYASSVKNGVMKYLDKKAVENEEKNSEFTIIPEKETTEKKDSTLEEKVEGVKVEQNNLGLEGYDLKSENKGYKNGVEKAQENFGKESTNSNDDLKYQNENKVEEGLKDQGVDVGYENDKPTESNQEILRKQGKFREVPVAEAENKESRVLRSINNFYVGVSAEGHDSRVAGNIGYMGTLSLNDAADKAWLYSLEGSMSDDAAIRAGLKYIREINLSNNIGDKEALALAGYLSGWGNGDHANVELVAEYIKRNWSVGIGFRKALTDAVQTETNKMFLDSQLIDRWDETIREGDVFNTYRTDVFNDNFRIDRTSVGATDGIFVPISYKVNDKLTIKGAMELAKLEDETKFGGSIGANYQINDDWSTGVNIGNDGNATQGFVRFTRKLGSSPKEGESKITPFVLEKGVQFNSTNIRKEMEITESVVDGQGREERNLIGSEGVHHHQPTTTTPEQPPEEPPEPPQPPVDDPTGDNGDGSPGGTDEPDPVEPPVEDTSGGPGEGNPGGIEPQE